jgi:U3 small nucleolar RNA-associated protein 23
MLYISRSVMIMEPMGGATEDLREREEKAKFKAGLKSRGSATNLRKRSRDDSESGEEEGVHPSRAANVAAATASAPGADAVPKAKRRKGPKGANPLSVKKPKSRREPTTDPAKPGHSTQPDAATGEAAEKKKRKRKPKPKVEVTDAPSP